MSCEDGMVHRVVLIADLDNTLYDWVAFYGNAFHAMLEQLERILGVSSQMLCNEFKEVHRRYGNIEQPFAALELESVKRRFPDKSRVEIARQLDEAFHAFNSARRRHLHLYQGVEETLAWLKSKSVTIIGCTDSRLINGYYRLQLLGIAKYFRRLYVASINHSWPGHPDPNRMPDLSPPPDFVREFPCYQRKPSPEILWTICEREHLDRSQTWYVGDSLVRDVSMARAAGIKAIWARYGANRDEQAWNVVVRVTHWTNDDVEREKELAAAASSIKPDYTIDHFSELKGLILV